MSDLILSWLNDEVQLSKKITSFEKDFSNGYYIGELLMKFNQQLNFNEFDNRDLVSAKNKNFKLLEPTLKILKVKLNIEKVDMVMKGEPGVAKKLLYNLKMALEKVNNPADVLIMHKTGKFNPINPLKKIEQPREKFDAMESRFFDKKIKELSSSQKAIDLEKHLEKFQIFQKNQEQEVAQMKESDRMKDIKIKDEMRKIQLNKLQRNMAFLENWNEKGKENWEKNQKIMKERSQKDEEFRAKTEEKKKIKLEIAHSNNEREVFEEIDSFEKKMKKIELESQDNVLEKNLEKSNIGIFSASATLLRIKEKKMVSDFQRKERDKRRRKMIVDQAKAQREIEVKKREEVLLDKLKQQSRQEKELSYEIWRANRCKDIIIDNRNLREELYKQKREQNVLSSKRKEEDMLLILKEELKTDMQSKQKRMSELQIEAKGEKRKINYENCNKIANEIINISDLFFKIQQDLDSKELKPTRWYECLELFLEGKPLIPYKTCRDPLGFSKIIQPLTDKKVIDSEDYLAHCELRDFIEGRNQWIPMHKFDQPENPETDQKYIPNEPINNFYLGNIIKFLIVKVLQEKSPLLDKKSIPEVLFDDVIPNYLPLKISVLGYDFSGKKTLISHLKRKYDLNVLAIDVLIEEALSKLEQYEIQLESAQEIEDPADLAETATELLTLAKSLREYLCSGSPIPDELYIKLITNKLRALYPPFKLTEFLNFYNNLSITERSRNNVNKSQSINSPPLTKEELELERLMTNEHRYTNGWILIDFPHTYEQAKLLENDLTKFVTKDEQGEREKDLLEEKLKLAEKIVKPLPVILKKRKLIRNGMDLVIHVKTDKKECLRRALGRRIDQTTKVHYHLDDAIPPTDNAPLVERLMNLREINENELVLIDKLVSFDNEIQEIKEFYNMFGIEELQQSNWLEINGHLDELKVFEDVSQICENLLSFKEEEFRIFENELNESKEQEIKIKEEEAARLEREKEITAVDVEEFKLELKGVSKAPHRDNIKIEGLKVLFNIWDHIQNHYLAESYRIFKNIFRQRELISMRFAEIQRRFLEILQRFDNRQTYVLAFQENYNNFMDSNKDMIEETATKEEMHQRVEDLHEILFELVENKREEVLEERKNVMNSGFIESEMDLFVNFIQAMVQNEMFRSFRSLQIINDFYALTERKDIPDYPEYFLSTLNGNYEGLAVENEENGVASYPRVEKIISDALRIYNGEEEEITQQAGKKGGKQPPPPPKKDDPKKKLGKGGKEVEEEKKEETPLEIELQKALNTEKAVFRYRIQILKVFAMNKLAEMKVQAKIIYNKLEDWTLYTHKIENDSIFELTKQLRWFIENEQKIQKEIQLNYVDVVKSYKVLNFLTPPLIMLSAKEKRMNDRFTITQLYMIIEEIRNIANYDFMVESKNFLLFLHRKIINGVSSNELPENWLQKNFKNFQNLISILDPEKTGFINGKAFCVYLCLLKSEIINELEKDRYLEELNRNSQDNLMIGLNEFLNVECWFDQTEKGEAEENANYFKREKHLKTLIFSLLKNSKDLLNIDSYIRILDLRIITQEIVDVDQLKTYYDFLFQN